VFYPKKFSINHFTSFEERKLLGRRKCDARLKTTNFSEFCLFPFSEGNFESFQGVFNIIEFLNIFKSLTLLKNHQKFLQKIKTENSLN
jgi:hypothetical protein